MAFAEDTCIFCAGETAELALVIDGAGPQEYEAAAAGLTFSSVYGHTDLLSLLGAPVYSAEKQCLVQKVQVRAAGLCAFGARVCLEDTVLSCACTVLVHDTAPLVLPEQTVSMEAGAFCNTACREVVLPAGLGMIDSEVFAGCDELRLIWIPASVTCIAGDAFPQNALFAVVCEVGSAAHRAAMAMNIPFLALQPGATLP